MTYFALIERIPLTDTIPLTAIAAVLIAPITDALTHRHDAAVVYAIQPGPEFGFACATAAVVHQQLRAAVSSAARDALASGLLYLRP